MSEFIPEDLFVGDPVLTMRWRLHRRALPLKNRHLRAFSACGVSNGLASWARQHIEWTLADGAGAFPDGVLVLAVDSEGRAEMTVEAYEGAPALSSAEIAERAAGWNGQAVPCEVLWTVEGGALVIHVEEGAMLSGANSFLADIAKTLKTPLSFSRRPEPGETFPQAEEAFLVSDEHGVVTATDAAGATAERFKGYLDRIVSLAKPDAFDCANLGIIG